MPLPHGQVPGRARSGALLRLDHCQGCKGIWLDRNEWEALKKRNLHDDPNTMFTSFWQNERRTERPERDALEDIYISRLFGADDYTENQADPLRWRYQDESRGVRSPISSIEILSPPDHRRYLRVTGEQPRCALQPGSERSLLLIEDGAT